MTIRISWFSKFVSLLELAATIAYLFANWLSLQLTMFLINQQN